MEKESKLFTEGSDEEKVSVDQPLSEKEMFFQFLNDDLDMALPSFRVMDFEDARAAIIAILDSGDNDRKIALKQKEKALVQVGGMNKHTPGPWKALVYPCNLNRIAIETSYAEIGIFHIFNDWEESKANANLVQGAPDMYDALKHLVHLHLCDMEGISCGQPTPQTEKRNED